MPPTIPALTEHAVCSVAHGLGRVLSQDQAHSLRIYLDLLVKWNQRMNLVGPGVWPEIMETLIQDSWHLADLLHSQGLTPRYTLDLGAGAGLPGIPMRMFWAQGEYFLVEPRHKRAIFMDQALVTLGLSRTRVLCMRMEDLGQEYRQAELIVSRAFKPWQNLLGDVRSYLAPGGQVVIMTTSPQPAQPVHGYSLRHVAPYVVQGKNRFFWLFAVEK